MAGNAKYLAVVDWVKEGIESGELKTGERLMSEKDLCEKFGLSRQTVRHATGELAELGLVTRIQGSGTYIGQLTKEAPKREKHHTIAVVSTFSDSYIFPPTLRGITRVLGEAGYSTQIAFTDNRVDFEQNILKSLINKDNIDGLIIEPSKSMVPNANLAYFQELQRRNIPIISFNAKISDIEAPCVRIDDRKVGDQAAQLLIDVGHKKIAGIFKSEDGQGRLRYAGYLDAMFRNGLDQEPQGKIWLDTRMMMHMEELSDHIFARLEGCSAVVCYNDEVAAQVVALAAQRGIRVPEDLSVVGVDNSDLAVTCRVPITSFNHPKEELGMKVAQNMLEMIQHPGFDGEYLFAAEVVMRESVTRL